jgi:hypothetical protein
MSSIDFKRLKLRKLFVAISIVRTVRHLPRMQYTQEGIPSPVKLGKTRPENRQTGNTCHYWIDLFQN